MRELIRNAQKQATREELENLLLGGLDSGPATPMTDSDWQTLRKTAERRWEMRADGEQRQ